MSEPITLEELQAIEAAAVKAQRFHVKPLPHENPATAARCYCGDVPRLLEEIRRLKDFIGSRFIDDSIQKAIREAVEAEREACAKLARSWCPGDVERDQPCGACPACAAASAIRARGKGEG